MVAIVLVAGHPALTIEMSGSTSLSSGVSTGTEEARCDPEVGGVGVQVDDLRRVALRVAAKYHLEPRRQHLSWQSRHGDSPPPQIEGVGPASLSRPLLAPPPPRFPLHGRTSFSTLVGGAPRVILSTAAMSHDICTAHDSRRCSAAVGALLVAR